MSKNAFWRAQNIPVKMELTDPVYRATGLVVKTSVKMPISISEFLDSNLTSGSRLQIPANADFGGIIMVYVHRFLSAM